MSLTHSFIRFVQISDTFKNEVNGCVQLRAALHYITMSQYIKFLFIELVLNQYHIHTCAV